MAATKAIGGIVENAEKWDPNADEDIKDEDLKEEPDVFIKPEIKSEAAPPGDLDLLSFDTLDIKSVLKYGKPLLGSSGKEYDYSLADLDPAERLAAQKRNVTARLGLGGEYLEEEIVTEKDFATAGKHSLPTPRIDTSMATNGSRAPIQSPAINSQTAVMSPMENTGLDNGDEVSGLSKRQLNALKRKAKANAKNHANKVRVVDLGSARKMSVNDVPTPAPVPTSTPNPVKKEEEDGEDNKTGKIMDYFSLDTSKPADDTKIVAEFKGPAAPPSPIIETSVEEMDWPFERLSEILEIDMFDQNWRIRHGAAMGLREVVKHHGAGAGRVRGKSRKENDELNQKWLEDLACRLICIFMLDRFGDYGTDTVSLGLRKEYGLG